MKYPSDTIIRKDVLDTLKWWQEEYPEIPHLAEIVADMEHLPPVQEQPEVVRCKDCMFGEKFSLPSPWPICCMLSKSWQPAEFYCACGRKKDE